MKKVFRVVVIVVILAAMAALVIRRKKQAMAAGPYGMRPVAVHVADVTRGPLEKLHGYLGVVEAVRSARISSRVSARVVTVLHDEGDSVKRGELLLQLDDSDIQARLQAVESSIQSLETNRAFWVEENKRDSQLAAEGVISRVEAETTHNRLAEALARLDAALRERDTLHTQLAYTRLTSPYDGLITARDVDPGDLAGPGRPLMVVEDHSTLKIAFDAPQEDMAFLKTGLPVRVEADVKAENLHVTHIYPSLNHARMVRVEVETAGDSGFKIGAFVPLRVVVRRHANAVTVPRESLMRRASGDWVVFSVTDNKLVLRPVRKIMEGHGRVEVSGVTPGEKVVTSTFLGWANLADGLRVEVMP